MKNSKINIHSFRLIFCILCCTFCFTAVFAQSTSQSFPTAITSNEISGTIKARDLGDSRLTTYFYSFEGNQGDVFINIVTKNFDGDIDIFTADNLRPITKIVVYSDTTDNETGRVFYLRQPTKLLLRIEGRTPNDDPATFRLKFAGSFQTTVSENTTEEPKLPEVSSEDKGNVRVNSVGTIIEAKPKPTPQIAKKVEEKETPKKEIEPTKKEAETVAKQDDKVEKTENEETQTVTEKHEKKAELIITNDLPASEEPEKTEKKVEEKQVSKTRTPKTKTVKPKISEKKVETQSEPNPLENIRLIVLFKDGTKIERPMSDVLKVSVDKGILTIINKDGSIGRYSILEVAKFTIE